MIDFFCPVCKTAQRAAEQEIGSKKACTHCGQRLQVPQAADFRKVAADQTVPGMLGAPARTGDSSLLSLPGDSLASDLVSGLPGRSKVKWFYVQHGKKIGPVFWPEMLRLVSAKEITPTDLVWSKGMKQWQPAREVAALWGHKPKPQDKAVGKPMGRGTQWKWIAIGSGAVAVVVVALVLLLVLPGSNSSATTAEKTKDGDTYGTKESKPPTKEANTPAAVQSSLPPRFIQGVKGTKNQKDLDKAVAYVLVALRITRKEDGKVIFRNLGTGSGFTISSEGHIITNRHVVAPFLDFERDYFGTLRKLIAKERLKPEDRQAVLENLQRMEDAVKAGVIEVKTCLYVYLGAQRYDARVLHVSQNYDMSVLKVERTHVPYFKISTTDEHENGTHTISLGFPGVAQLPLTRQSGAATPDELFEPSAFKFFQTQGAINRVVSYKDQNDAIRQTWIQHEARIRPGNSGGPLVTEDGVVVGINTMGIAKPGEETDMIDQALAVAQLRAEIKQKVPEAMAGQ